MRRSRDDDTVERVGRDVREVVASLEEHEPATSALISALQSRRVVLERRAWNVIGRDTEAPSVVVLERLCFDRWTCRVHLADPNAATAIAPLVDRSPAVSVSGTSEQMRVLVPHLERARGVESSRWLVAPHPVGKLLDPPDDHTRVATIGDLDELVELYSSYELLLAPTRWQLREYLQHLLTRQLIVVYDGEPGIAGAVTLPGRTKRFILAADFTVHPAHRRRGVGWELVKRVEQLAAGMRLGVAAVFGPTNPFDGSDHDVWATDSVTSVWLGHRRRFKGQTRLRRLSRRFQPLERRPTELFWDPSDPSQRYATPRSAAPPDPDVR